ncbi:helix-turn-helix domain-containing protein [Amnibacterium endophyticum]|uniref:Helix-turn-helix domain-containing protein n=1 Tax=Amnibacterium endophyticum TaxID=2109337 RepID=A0ABW4LID8_9MICO
MPGALLRQRFAAANAEDATTAVRSVLGDGAVTADGGVSLEILSAVDDGVTVTRIASSGRGVRLDTGPSPELVVFAVREGRLTLARSGGSADLGPGDLGLVPTGTAAELRWDGVVVDAVSIGASSMVRLLSAEGRPPRLSDARITPQSPELGELWDRLARVLAGTVLEAPDLYQRDLVRAQMIDVLAATTIEAFDLVDRADSDLDRDEAVLQRAESWMRERLGEPLAVSDIAAAAGVSLRGLQLLYQRKRASTPLLHLRSMRLEAARAALLRGTEPVGAIARRLGYTNLGRFSAHYREAFGEAPSATQRAGA